MGVTPVGRVFTVSEQGAVGGILAELLIRTLDRMDVPYNIRAYPPERLRRNFISGVSSLTIGVKANLHRGEKLVLYSKNPVYKLQMRVFSLASRPLVDQFEDLLGERVGLIRGYQYGSGRDLLAAPSNSGRIVDVSSHLSGLNLLSKNRIDYFLDYRRAHVAETAIRGRPLHQRVMQTVDMYFVVSAQHPEAQQLMESLERVHSESLE